MPSVPINMSRIAQLLEQVLVDDTRTASAEISRSETVNNDPQRASKGWIGIYRSNIKYDPRTLGRGGSNYKGELTIFIVCQKTSMDSGADAEEELEELIGNVLSVILDNTEIRGSIGMLNAFEVVYSYNRTKEKTAYFQEAVIKLVGLSQT